MVYHKSVTLIKRCMTLQVMVAIVMTVKATLQGLTAKNASWASTDDKTKTLASTVSVIRSALRAFNAIPRADAAADRV